MELIEFGSIMHMQKGKKPSKQIKNAEEGYLPYVDIKGFETGEIDSYTNDSSCVPCNENDILIVCDGSRSGLVGRAIKGYVGSTLAKIWADGMSSDYLYYFLQGQYLLLNTRKKGTGTPHLNANILKKQKLVVPSMEEQQQIVSYIEELFSDLDNGDESLHKAQDLLNLYEQSILNDFYNSNGRKTVLLSDICDEIRIGPFGTLLHKSDYISQGIPVINPQNIKNHVIIPDFRKCINKHKAMELSSYLLKENDVIMGRRGQMGRTAVVTKSEAGWLCGTGSVIVRLKKEFDADSYSKVLSSPSVVDYLKNASTGTTMNNLNEGIICKIPVPIIEKKDMGDLKNKIGETTKKIVNLRASIDAAKNQSTNLRQSILKKAFEGELTNE